MTKMEDEVTPEALRPQRARTESAQSPPAAPPCFNPPAESPPDPAASITPPSSAEPSPQASTSNIHDLINSSSGPTSPASVIPRRPDLRAVQRLSDDVILSSPGTESQGSTSGSPAGSEGGEHLQEMRDRLLSESSGSTATRRDSDPTPRQSMDINVIAPTPPLPPEEEQPTSSPEAGPSRLRNSPLSAHSPQLQSFDAVSATEHSWDSVWPASVQPRQLGPDPNVPPFSPAPVSPFVTPTFSAPAPLVNRKPMSPTLPPGSPTAKRATSPVRYSPRTMSASSEGSSGSCARSPTHSSSSRHARTHSSGSSMMRPTLDHLPRPTSPSASSGQAEMLASTSKQRINDSLSRLSDAQSPSIKPRTASNGSGARPRRTSFGDAQSRRLDPELKNKVKPAPSQTVHEADIPPLPPTDSFSALPPAVASPPFSLSGDDGSIATELFSPPLVAPLSRPAPLRRALSDYDPAQRSAPSPFHRTLSVTTELDKSPTQSVEATAIRNSPDSRRAVSPRFRPNALPPPVSEAATYSSDPDTPVVKNDEVGDLNLVDEGDVLPTGDYQMDVTFDDEGLNTLERIFLLSQSDFAFHRAYVARVLGDLLEDVDPCESVEYVLPLLNGYSVDEDETVKEAFSSELHRVLWYFFSTCRLTSEPGETLTITSEGVEMVPKPTLDEMPDVPAVDTTRRGSVISAGGPSSAGSSLTNPKSSLFEHSDSDTPNSVTSVSSDQTAFSPLPWVDANIGADSAKEPAQLVAQPELPIGSFTPLLGNLMLSPNPIVGDHTRDAIIAVISRLRGIVDEEKWIRSVGDQDKRKTYSSQTGYHAHDLRPFAAEVKTRVETELLNGIVLGMGCLSTDLPESYTDGASSHEHPDGESLFLSEDAEAFKTQLVQEAEAGRAISLFLIGSLCDVYSGQEVVHRGFFDEVLRATNGDETTRTEGAVALSRMAKIVPVERVDELLDAFHLFVSDESLSVRQAVAVALPAIAKRLDDKQRKRDFAVSGAASLMRSGGNCRCSALEILGELIHLFHEDPDGPPQELLDFYWDDSDDKEVYPGDCLWDIIAAYNFPGVCLTLGPDRWPELRELLQRLQDRGGEKVLTTIASFLHEIAKILRPEQVAEDLLPVYTRLIDAKDDIRERVFEHVDAFIVGLPHQLAWMTFLGLAEAWKCNSLGGWRAREAVALHIPAFLEVFVGRDVDITPILDMTLAALLDRFAAVRDAAIQGIPESYITVTSTRFDRPFREMLLDLSTASSYRQRVTFTRCLKEFIKPPPHREPFEEFFAPAMPRLRTDVVDVRIALAQIVAALFITGAYYAVETEIPPVISQLAQALAEDDAPDVRDTVRHIDLDRLRKGKGTQTGGDHQDVLPDEAIEGEHDRRRPGIMPLPSDQANGKASGNAVSSRIRRGDSDETPTVGKHHESDSNRTLNPFASSFRDAVHDEGEEVSGGGGSSK